MAQDWTGASCVFRNGDRRKARRRNAVLFRPGSLGKAAGRGRSVTVMPEDGDRSPNGNSARRDVRAGTFAGQDGRIVPFETGETGGMDRIDRIDRMDRMDGAGRKGPLRFSMMSCPFQIWRQQKPVFPVSARGLVSFFCCNRFEGGAGGFPFFAGFSFRQERIAGRQPVFNPVWRLANGALPFSSRFPVVLQPFCG